MGELKKVGFTPSLQTNVCAPDPQKIIDLQVRDNLLYKYDAISIYLLLY